MSFKLLLPHLFPASVQSIVKRKASQMLKTLRLQRISAFAIMVSSFLLSFAPGQAFRGPILLTSKRTGLWLDQTRHFFAAPTVTTTRLFSSTTTPTSNNDTAEKKIPRKFTPFPFGYHQELTLRVESLTNLGMGICRTPVEVLHNDVDDASATAAATTTQSWVIFCPNVIPGELVTLRVFRNHKSYSEADLIQVVEPSPDRVEAPCPLFSVCGGCQYQHMTVHAQRHWKTQQVQEVLERIGGFELEQFQHLLSPTFGTEQVWNYRSKITPHYDAPHKVGEHSYQIREIGFKQKASRQLVDVPQCWIATEAINEKLTDIREERRQAALDGMVKRPKRGATLLLRDAAGSVVTDPNQYVTETVSGLQFRFLAGNFFQNNPFILPHMVQYVVDAATKPNHEQQPMTHLIDTYCGSGLFCLSASSHFKTCVGIEVNDKAIAEATANAVLNNRTNCHFVAASAEAIFESSGNTMQNDNDGVVGVEDFPRSQTVVVCDPPRKGCSEEFLQQLFHFRPQRLVYMSCDVATQARDAKIICSSQGGYEMTSIQPFDLFPQTRHIECLIVFEKRKV